MTETKDGVNRADRAEDKKKDRSLIAAKDIYHKVYMLAVAKLAYMDIYMAAPVVIMFFCVVLAGGPWVWWWAAAF